MTSHNQQNSINPCQCCCQRLSESLFKVLGRRNTKSQVMKELKIQKFVKNFNSAFCYFYKTTLHPCQSLQTVSLYRFRPHFKGTKHVELLGHPCTQHLLIVLYTTYSIFSVFSTLPTQEHKLSRFPLDKFNGKCLHSFGIAFCGGVADALLPAGGVTRRVGELDHVEQN